MSRLSRQDWGLVGVALTFLVPGILLVYPGGRLLGVGLILAGLIAFAGPRVWLWARRQPRLYREAGKAKAAAIEIYKEAARDGGELFASHILPRDPSVQEDIAVGALANAKPDVPLTFRRILITESSDLERAWVFHSFEKLPSEHTSLTLYLLERYPLVLPRFVQSVLPRANVLLYRRENRYVSLVGLDRFSLDDSEPEAAFGVRSLSKRVHYVLWHYLGGIAEHPEIIPIKRLDKYTNTVLNGRHRKGVNGAIQRILELGQREEAIVHAGIFGSVAKRATGLHSRVGADEHEPDLDVMVVYENGGGLDLEEIKGRIAEYFPFNRYHIVWGDDDREFYGWRQHGKVNLDIEVQQADSRFYRDNQLLGTSIFRFYRHLYPLGGAGAKQHLRLPQLAPQPSRKRWQILLDDRKGLKDFERRLGEPGAPLTTDPRRVTSLVVRNAAWAMYGEHPATVDIAFRHLEPHWTGIFPSVAPGRARAAIAEERSSAVRRSDELIGLALTLVRDCAAYASEARRDARHRFGGDGDRSEPIAARE